MTVPLKLCSSRVPAVVHHYTDAGYTVVRLREEPERGEGKDARTALETRAEHGALYWPPSLSVVLLVWRQCWFEPVHRLCAARSMPHSSSNAPRCSVTGSEVDSLFSRSCAGASDAVTRALPLIRHLRLWSRLLTSLHRHCIRYHSAALLQRPSALHEHEPAEPARLVAGDVSLLGLLLLARPRIEQLSHAVHGSHVPRVGLPVAT